MDNLGQELQNITYSTNSHIFPSYYLFEMDTSFLNNFRRRLQYWVSKEKVKTETITSAVLSLKAGYTYYNTQQNTKSNNEINSRTV